MNSEIIERDGKLFVLDPWQNHFSLPIKYRIAWPTGIFAKDWPNYVGKTVRPNGNGTYRFDNGLFLRLEHGGDTKPSQEYSEERRIPKPPMKKNIATVDGVCNVQRLENNNQDQA
jgi:hypothetical protein